MNGKEASIAYKMKGLLPSDLHKSYYPKAFRLFPLLTQQHLGAVHEEFFAGPHIVHHLFHLDFRLAGEVELVGGNGAVLQAGYNQLMDAMEILVGEMALALLQTYITLAAGSRTLLAEIVQEHGAAALVVDAHILLHGMQTMLESPFAVGIAGGRKGDILALQPPREEGDVRHVLAGNVADGTTLGVFGQAVIDIIGTQSAL